MCLPAPISKEKKAYRCIECDWEYGLMTARFDEIRLSSPYRLLGVPCLQQVCPRCKSPYYYCDKEAA